MRRAIAPWRRIVCAGALAALTTGCLTTPNTGSPKLGPVDTGPGTVEATRRALAGHWSLARLEVIGADGATTQVKARGTLTYDEFGNLAIHGSIDDARLASAITLEYTGRILIDPAKHEFYPRDFESDTPVDSARIAPVALDKVRRYELTAARFVVTYLDASGKPTAIATWTRLSQ